MRRLYSVKYRLIRGDDGTPRVNFTTFLAPLSQEELDELTRTLLSEMSGTQWVVSSVLAAPKNQDFVFIPISTCLGGVLPGLRKIQAAIAHLDLPIGHLDCSHTVSAMIHR